MKGKKKIFVYSVITVLVLVITYLIYRNIRLKRIYANISTQSEALADIQNPSYVIDKYSGSSDDEQLKIDIDNGLYQAADMQGLLADFSDDDLNAFINDQG